MAVSEAEKWLSKISTYEREFKKWEQRADKILKRYRDEGRRSVDTAKFNILWSNVQTLAAATFAKLPKPDVSRRFKDQDPVGRVAALILERSLEYEIQKYTDYSSTLRSAIHDRFLGGRGTAWVRYEPHFRAVRQNLPQDGEQVTEDVETQEELDYECAPCDYVHWKDFGHAVGRTWDEVTAVWRRVYLSRNQCVERFGEELGNKIPLDSKPEDRKEKQGDEDDRALIIEIWDKTTKEAIWLSKSMKQVIDKKDDPLGLEDFFPCPRPLFATVTNDSLVPIPDFTLYQDQANALDILCDRIDGLIKALKIFGVYDASAGDLQRLFTESENTTLIPVKDWTAFSEKAGLKGSLDIVDLTPISNALKEAYIAFEQLKAQVYEITGISDIVRGQTDPRETLGAQELKGQYASLRLKSYQEEVSRFATELLQIKAQIICGKFSPQTIQMIGAVNQLSEADKKIAPQALALLVGPERMANPDAPQGPNPIRSFRIEVAADTLVYLDEQAEKQGRIEFLTAVSGFMEKAVAAGSQTPQLAPVLMEMLKFGVTAFKVGKTIEGTIDQAMDQIKQAAANPQQRPDPEMEKVKAEREAEQRRLQSEQQIENQRMQMEQAARLKEQQLAARLEKMKLDMQFEQEAAMNRQQSIFDQWKAELDAQTKVLVAEIAAKATAEKAQISAANESSKS